MSLVNRQNYTPAYGSFFFTSTTPSVIETPSSLWIRGYEHDPSTLTPLFGRQFHPTNSQKATLGMIYTKYSGCIASVEYNGNSFIDRTDDFMTFNLEDINRGMKDVPLYRWSDGFNYYISENGGYKFWRYNPNNQNLIDGTGINKGNTISTDWATYPYRGGANMHIVDEDINNIYTINVTELTNGTYYRANSFPSVINKNINTTTNAEGLVSSVTSNVYSIGRSSSRIYFVLNNNSGRTFSLYSYNKTLCSISINRSRN